MNYHELYSIRRQDYARTIDFEAWAKYFHRQNRNDYPKRARALPHGLPYYFWFSLLRNFNDPIRPRDRYSTVYRNRKQYKLETDYLIDRIKNEVFR